MSKRKLYISIERSTTALSTKESAEAYILALMIKASTISARINNPTIANLTKILHIGRTKCCRALKNALSFGYIRYEGKTIVANILKENKDNVRPILFERSVHGTDNSLRCSMSFREMEKLVREQIVLNHVKKQKLCEKTFKAASGGFVDGELLSLKQIKSARLRQKRLSHTKRFHKGLSLCKVTKILHSSRYAARKIMRELVYTKRLIKNEVFEKTGIDPKKFGRQANEYMKQIGYGGYFLYRDGEIVCQRSNVYICNDELNSKYHAK